MRVFTVRGDARGVLDSQQAEQARARVSAVPAERIEEAVRDDPARRAGLERVAQECGREQGSCTWEKVHGAAERLGVGGDELLPDIVEIINVR